MKLNLLLALFIFSIPAATPVSGQTGNSSILNMGNQSSIWSPEVKSIKLSTGPSLDYVEKGNAHGVPIIFLHGITDSWISFETVMKRLPAHIHGFAITQRGHGDSDKPASGFTPKDFASDVAAFIQELKLGPVFIAGHSMGGLVGLRFAIDYPQLTKGLIIIDSDPFLKSNPGMPEFQELVNQLNDPVDSMFAAEFQKSTLAKPIDTENLRVYIGESLKVPAYVWKEAMRGLIDSDFRAETKNITCPTLILWGEKDAICIKEGQEQLAMSIKHSRLIAYENTGHALHWEEPLRFITDLVDFVDRAVVFNNH